MHLVLHTRGRAPTEKRDDCAALRQSAVSAERAFLTTNVITPEVLERKRQNY